MDGNHQPANFEDASDNFGRALAIGDLVQVEARHALETEDYAEVNLCRENLANTISNLERKLATVLQIAEDAEDLPLGTIVHWRQEQKKQLSNMKKTLKQLTLKSQEEIARNQAVEEQQNERRRAFEDKERDREDQQRERELQWIRIRNEAQQCQVGTIKMSSGNAESSLNNVASPDYVQRQYDDQELVPEQHLDSHQGSIDQDMLAPESAPSTRELQPPLQNQSSTHQLQPTLQPQYSTHQLQPSLQHQYPIHQPESTVQQKSTTHSVQSPAEMHQQTMQQPFNSQIRQPNSVNQQSTMEQIQQQMMQLQQQVFQLHVNPNNQQSSQVMQPPSFRKTNNPIPTAVKLQRYTITPFKGEYRDWVRFWNQFSVEVDASGLAEISKFNYLLELVKGKPRDDIMGLPHTEVGYKTAKAILEKKYGRDTKVKRAVLKELEDLEAINYNSSNKIDKAHEFYNKLSKTVRTLETMGALDKSENFVFSIMDKLGPIREYLIQKDDSWEEWSLTDLVDNLEKYIERNPPTTRRTNEQGGGSRQEYRPTQTNWRQRDDNKHHDGARYRRQEFGMMGKTNQTKTAVKCIYCQSEQHYSDKCDKVLDVAARRDLLFKQKLCYNCASSSHRVSDCKSKRGCYHCGDRHHSSLCQKRNSTMGDSEKTTQVDKSSKPSEKGYSSVTSSSVIHPSAIVKVGDREVRLVCDTLSGSNYICSDLITYLKLRPRRKEKKSIEQMFGTVNKLVEIYDLKITSKINGTSLQIQCINAERPLITHLPNPQIKKIKEKQPRMQQLVFTEEESTGDYLPVHILLGVNDFKRIRLQEAPVIGCQPHDPLAEMTKLGWIMYGGSTQHSGTELCHFTMTGQQEFEKLCNLDVLGLKESTAPTETLFDHETFKQQIVMGNNGKYHTSLPWRAEQMDLPDNKTLSYGRLISTTKKLQKLNKMQDYDAIMQEQIKLGMLKPVSADPADDRVHYIPHHPVFKESETTPLRIVYDCSAKADKQSPSLNDCLETGPPLQPHLFDILLRLRFRRYNISGDIAKAFHQINLTEKDQHLQRVLWYDNLVSRNILEYKFTRVIFGATSSPYILGATLEKHIQQYNKDGGCVHTINSLLSDTYVDDVQGGGDKIDDVKQFKKEATLIMKEGGFKLYKWHSNVRDAEDCDDYKPTTKILGITWNKPQDTLAVSATTNIEETLTKRKVLSVINGVFDPLQWTAPFMITAKLIFSEICLSGTHWDEALSKDITSRWNEWIATLQHCHQVTVPRSVCSRQGSTFEFHGFADASQVAVCAAIYAVECNQGKILDRNLLVAKSRVAPKDLTIPRLELVAAHTLAKLMANVTASLTKVPITNLHYWSDSTTALHWLRHKGTWSVFVRNRVNKIQELTKNSQWRHVPTQMNPSDLGTRGISPNKIGALWLKGPEYLSRLDDWPTQPEITGTADTSKEEVVPKVKTMMTNIQEVNGINAFIDKMTQRFNYQKIIRITAWMLRFKRNCLKEGYKGPLQTSELKQAEDAWIRLTQQSLDTNEMDRYLDEDNIWKIDSRIPDYKPILLPQRGEFTRRLIEYYHLQTLHGGVQSTMVKIRERFWIPKLRTLVKTLIHKCNLCKQFRIKRLKPPATSELPEFRAEFTTPFAATGVDFAGPLFYKTVHNEGKMNKAMKTEKIYIAIFTCAATRAVHLSLCRDLSAHTFQGALKEFVARRGKPSLIVSDNAKTFQSTSEWLKHLKQDDDLFNYLGQQNIRWKFNLSRAPWWGGFYERLIGIMKRSLSKSIGQSLLTYDEFKETLLDVECFMNERPLTYVGDEYDQKILTPNLLIRDSPGQFLEEDLDKMNYTNEKVLITKRWKYLQRTREQLRRRWQQEYLHALQERHTHNIDQRQEIPQQGSVVLITDSFDSIKPKWTLGKVTDIIRGKDNIVRGLKVKCGSGYTVDRPLQLVRNLEISAHTSQPYESTETCLNTSDTNTVQKVQESLTLKDSESTSTHHNTRRQRRAKSDAVNKMAAVALNELDQQ